MKHQIKQILSKVKKASIGCEPCRGAVLPSHALRAKQYAEEWSSLRHQEAHTVDGLEENPLKAYFDAHCTGKGIWKWEHYFDAYHTHFKKFIGQSPHVAEVGIYSGGSLDMWHHYFGPGCRVTGVDIEEACQSYTDDKTSIFIGDQADRPFWRKVKERVPPFDVFIDDGGHMVEQQIATLEEILPHMNYGGIYVCEDVHGHGNAFWEYANALTSQMHAFSQRGGDDILSSPTTSIQSSIRSIHYYPYMYVIEMNNKPQSELVAPKHGTQWQPFYKGSRLVRDERAS